MTLSMNIKMIAWLLIFKYKKTYYQDRDVKPKEDLLLTITLFPLTQYEQKVDQSLYRD